MTTTLDTTKRATGKDWAALVVLAFAVLLIAVDATVLDLALPMISADLAPTTPQLLWIIDVYSFVLAGLLVVMGTLGDRIGRRRLLLIGAAGFGLASLIAAWSISPEMLIAARVLQGVSGATLMPATLGLIRSIFADPRQRTLAIAVWSAMAGGGAAVGPLLGGWLLEHFWWGSVFLVNLPVMIVLLALGPLVIPESRDPKPGRFDLPSAALSILAMIPIVYAVKETAAHGFSAGLAFVGLFGVLAAVVFVRRQQVLADPMIDLSLFRHNAFRTAIVTDLLAVSALAGMLFFGSQYLQIVLGYAPLDAGLLMLPGTATSIVTSLLAAWLVRFWSRGTVLGTGITVTALGAAMLIGLQAGGGASLFVAGFVLVGAGVGVSLTIASDMVVSAVPPERAGAASAVAETSYELGVALGVAVLGSVVMAVFRSGLADTHIPSESLGGAAGFAQHDPAALTAVHESFVSGIHVASIAIALLLTAAAVVAFRLRRA